MRGIGALALGAALAAGCASAGSGSPAVVSPAVGVPVAVAAGADSSWTQETLYFGGGSSAGVVVDSAAWTRFVAEEIGPRFAGFTVLNAVGFWRGQREPTRVLVVLYQDSLSRRAAALDTIVDRYCRRFAQESVLRVRQRVTASFPGPLPAGRRP